MIEVEKKNIRNLNKYFKSSKEYFTIELPSLSLLTCI